MSEQLRSEAYVVVPPNRAAVEQPGVGDEVLANVVSVAEFVGPTVMMASGNGEVEMSKSSASVASGTEQR